MMTETIKAVENATAILGTDANLNKVVLSIELVVYSLALPEVKKLEDLDNIIPPDQVSGLNEEEQVELLSDKLKEIKRLVSFKDNIVDNFGVEYVKMLVGSLANPEDLESLSSDLMIKIKKAAVIAA